MTGTLPATATSELGQTAQPLLPLKLTPPPPREGVLLRPDLQALLSEVRLHPLTLVIAPAGYGKTTLLSQWTQDLNRTGAPVCWLTLDSGERSPAMFLAYLIRAFQSAFPSVGADAWRVLHSAANLDIDWPLVAGGLCKDLQHKLPTATFLVLDDLHLAIDSVVICQILGYLLRAAPPTLHIIAASRRVPTFAPLARLRAEDQLLEIVQRDLHLSADEVRQILAAQDVMLNEAELALLLDRTEGWVLSVQLAARALAALPEERRGKFVRALGGSQEQLLSYLASEVLVELSQEVIDFLRLAALPAYFDAALLEKVLLYDNIPYLLQRALRLGLPILPLDAHGDQLRFHPLWRELLLRGVDETIDRETQVTLHYRFGRALEAGGDLEAALDHYAKAGAMDDLARALRERAWPLLQSPRRDVVRHWLEQLPLGVRENDAELLYIWGMSQIAADPVQAVTAIERAAERYHQVGLFERELRALADLAALLFWQLRPHDFVAICIRAVRAANQVRDAWSTGAARVCVTAMLYSKGRYVSALRTARQATMHPLNPAWHWLLAMIVSSINCQLGRPNEAIAAIDEALRLNLVDHDDRLRQNLLRQRGQALYDQGQIPEALALALDAHRHLGDYYHDGTTTGFSATHLALLLVLQGRVEEAMTYVTQARTAFHAIGALGPLASLQVIEIYGLLLRGQTANACSAVGSVLHRLQEAAGPTPDLRLWLMLALVLGESGEHQRACTLTGEIVQQMQRRGYRLFLACAHLYHAHLSHYCGDQQTRLAALHAGWALMVADNHRYLPMLPATALRDVIATALREGIDRQIVGHVLRRQLPDQAVEVLQELLSEPAAGVRMNAAHLLGDVGAAAYPSLRALLKERDPGVRQAAEDALSRLVYRPPYTLRIRTLGSFGLWRGDQEVRDRDWRSSKARQLFQFLLTERGRNLPRERILDTLWPEMEQDAAANNLRVTLNRLSKAIEPDRPDGAPPSYIIQQGDTYGFNLSCDHQLDAADFAAAVAEGQRAERQGQRQTAIVEYQRAMGLYGGPYLPDNMYEDWTVVERERLTLLFNEAAIHLGTLLLDKGLAHEAIGLAWRVLDNDQAHEESYRLLMQAHAYLGERTTALRLYTRCLSMLRQELGVDPLPETTAFYNTLREMR